MRQPLPPCPILGTCLGLVRRRLGGVAPACSSRLGRTMPPVLAVVFRSTAGNGHRLRRLGPLVRRLDRTAPAIDFLLPLEGLCRPSLCFRWGLPKGGRDWKI